MTLIKAKPKLTQSILRDVLKAAREDQDLSHQELAQIVCLRKWHIQELEEADTFLTFYTMEIKIQAAKRVGNYLGLSEDQFLSTN
jgi:ribosome-binding protein aMBF1 (putative translation factor)